MKKTIISAAILLLGFNVFAQDSLLVNKNGSVILPQKGDIAVGLSADPFLTYVGNMFNGTTGNSLNLGDQNLYFRYFLKNNEAVRVKIRISSTKNVENFYIQDDAVKVLDPLSQRQVEDRQTTISNYSELRAGYQFFRGYKRLQGFYGGDLGFSCSKYEFTREYGNKMTELNPTPTTHWGNLASRTLEFNGGKVKTFSLGIFAGAEYYVMPKVCIGAEFGIQYGKMWESQSNDKTEEMVMSEHVTYKHELRPGDSRRNLTTTFPYSYGSLYIMIHF